MLPMFLAIVDQTIVATALPAIAGDLGNVDQVSWIVVAYLVAATIIAPVYGRLGDVYGRRRLLFAALCITMTGSLLCALSQSMAMLAAARVLQGLGGGGLMTISQALVGEAIPPRDRARYQGYVAAVAVTSSTFGPVIGGLLTQLFGWQSVFLVNIPIGVLAVFLTLRLPVSDISEKPFRFDFLGVLLFAVFIASAIGMLQQVQRMRIDAVMLTSVLFALAAVACLLLLWREKKASDPLLPLPLLREPSIWRADAMAALHGGTLVSLMTFTPIYLRVMHGLEPAKTGLLLLPMAAGVGIGSMVTGRIVSRTGRTAIFPSFGLVAVTVMLIALSLLSPHLSAGAVSAFLGVTAIFMGTVMGVVQVTVQQAVGRGQLGIGAATVQFSRSLGAALGTAIVTTVLFMSLGMRDPEAARMLGSILQNARIVTDLPGQEQALLHSEIGEAFRAGFLAMAVFTAASATLAWSLPLRRI
ncbi:MFS transporter [Rhizobiales bacterium L72]|uniref:MFS transporter n=2 Tax=Propylenella binzhouense TaxID=2555902 RepID=A0A964T7Z8_9HYPH|nr:MFS transporter [Propylenella binzhouense]